MIKTLNSLDKGGNVVDLTGATADYPLQVGETASITYVSTTSVPLRVAMVVGVYELIIDGSTSSTVSDAGNDVKLWVNNTNSQSVFTHYYFKTSTTTGNGSHTTTSVALGQSNTYYSHCIICNNDALKHVSVTSANNRTGTEMHYLNFESHWTSGTWTSMGTVVFPVSQSGKIIIRRIA